MLTMKNLEVCFNSAKEHEYPYIGIKYKIESFEKPEITIIPIENYDKRLEDYKDVCNDDLTFKYKYNDKIKIVGFTMGNDFDEIESDLVD